MKYAVAFIVFSVALVYWAIVLGGFGWLLLWPALSFVLAALAYGGMGPALFAKRPDGTLPWQTWVLLGPFILFNSIVWHLQRKLSKESPWDEVYPNLYVGRRPLSGELPHHIRQVVDLTAEFPAAGDIVSSTTYINLPVLDATAPEEARLRELLSRVTADVPTLLHCAQGHGRSGTVAAAWLIRHGLAANVDAAEAILKSKRPGIRLNQRQRALVKRLAGMSVAETTA